MTQIETLSAVMREQNSVMNKPNGSDHDCSAINQNQVQTPDDKHVVAQIVGERIASTTSDRRIGSGFRPYHISASKRTAKTGTFRFGEEELIMAMAASVKVQDDIIKNQNEMMNLNLLLISRCLRTSSLLYEVR